MLLKVIFFAYIRGVFSSRQIEKLCQENVLFIALSGDLRPDHATIARFVSRMENHITSLFQQLLLYCDELGLISGEHLAIDGCKISSNAAKESSGTFAELKKKQERLKTVAQGLITKAKAADSAQDYSHRVAKHHKKIERIKAFLEKNEKRMGSRGKEIKSNITDNESAKLFSSHGIQQGYNAMAAVDSKRQVIVSTQAEGSIHEGPFLKDLIDKAKLALPGRITKNTTVLADTGYFSEENCRLLFENGQSGIIPDNHFRQRDPRYGRKPTGRSHNPRLPKSGKFTSDLFTHDAKLNQYICPAGKRLGHDGKKNNHGHLGHMYRNKIGDCISCHLQTQCLRKGAKSRSIFIVETPKSKTFSEKMKALIDSPEGRELYSKRMGIVEPVFGNITVNKRLNRFHYRGKAKVNTVWKLYCMVHNIEKIHNFGKT
jgi:hypothetical protein